MHELAIAQSIVSTVEREIERRNLSSVQKIVVRIGALSGILADALAFSFEAITLDTPLQNTKLEIENVPVHGKCRTCGHEFNVEDLVFACPRCDSAQIEVTKGLELDIAYLEVET